MLFISIPAHAAVSCLFLPHYPISCHILMPGYRYTCCLKQCLLCTCFSHFLPAFSSILFLLSAVVPASPLEIFSPHLYISVQRSFTFCRLLWASLLLSFLGGDMYISGGYVTTCLLPVPHAFLCCRPLVLLTSASAVSGVHGAFSLIHLLHHLPPSVTLHLCLLSPATTAL